MRVAVLCGGVALERGISLNSARSLLDHLSPQDITIVTIYFDTKKRAYHLLPTQLYSNTPSDFDFKLRHSAKLLSNAALINLLKTTDIVFPVIHGIFGEDGGIQSFLAQHHIPFVGTEAKHCKRLFNKFSANQYIKQHGFFTLPTISITANDHCDKRINHFFKKYQLQRAIVKPANGGSSIGVFAVTTPKQASSKAAEIFASGIDKEVVIEPFAIGSEFTIIVLQNRFNLPVALIPTAIKNNENDNEIFDFRKKYLPSQQVSYHCPPPFDNDIIETIQTQAEQLFALFGMRDFARFDGWLLAGGNIWFSDFNPISGMEQNSFLFMQASRIGMTHGQVLSYILQQACRRYDIACPFTTIKPNKTRKTIAVLFGGNNAERQVSLISGTNVWLKLLASKKYYPKPYLLDLNGNVWHLPYSLALNHTVEEIQRDCQQYQHTMAKLSYFNNRIITRLGINANYDNTFFVPQKMTLSQFINQNHFVFIALHGGQGENGTLQQKLSQSHVKFNGPDEKAARLCMDKWQTAKRIKQLNITGIKAMTAIRVATPTLLAFSATKLAQYWQYLKKHLNNTPIIIKPNDDGCSCGVVTLYRVSDLKKYLALIKSKAHMAKANTFYNQLMPIELPTTKPRHFLFEKFIATDKLVITDQTLHYRPHNHCLEITIGVVEKNKQLVVFNPSITITTGKVLTVEEKFQGGTGVNITPPPSDIIAKKTLTIIKKRISQLVSALAITGYCRIDAFVNVNNGDIMIIEINALPALTPSTVFYHQALAQKPAITPLALLELLITNKLG